MYENRTVNYMLKYLLAQEKSQKIKHTYKFDTEIFAGWMSFSKQ